MSMPRLGNAVWCSLLCLATACGRTRDEAPVSPGVAGGANGPSDASVPVLGQHVLALINEQVQLVHFDDPSSPITMTVPDSQGATSVAFTNDGTGLAYAVGAVQGPWQVRTASTLDGSTFGAWWSIPSGTSPTLIWVQNETLIARRSAPESSFLLRVGDGSVTDIGAIFGLSIATDQSALIALFERNLLFVSASATEWSPAISGEWLARLSADGRALAVFGREELPAFDLPIPTTRVQWSPPMPPSCVSTPPQPCPGPPKYTLSDVEWRSSDSRIAMEFRAYVNDATHMALVFMKPGSTERVSAPTAIFPAIGRNWGVWSNGDWFMLENPDEPTNDSWWIRSVGANNESARAKGPWGFAQRALSSADEKHLFVLSYARSAERSSLEVVALPVSNSSVPTTLFSTPERIDGLWPEPRGSRVLIGTSAQVGQSDPPYSLATPDALSQTLPNGLRDVQWTPSGGSFVGILRGSVVYIDSTAIYQPFTLGRGSYVLPNHW